MTETHFEKWRAPRTFTVGGQELNKVIRNSPHGDTEVASCKNTAWAKAIAALLEWDLRSGVEVPPYDG